MPVGNVTPVMRGSEMNMQIFPVRPLFYGEPDGLCYTELVLHSSVFLTDLVHISLNTSQFIGRTMCVHMSGQFLPFTVFIVDGCL